MLRRLVVIVFGFVIASGAGAVFLLVGALSDATTREAGLETVLAGIFAALDEAMNDGDPQFAMGALGHVLWMAFVATCAAPLAAAALIGEVAGARSIVWYSGVSGVLAGAAPWIARAARGMERLHSASEAESRFALLFFLTGALTGALYWLIAAPREKPAAAPVRGAR